jgi:hypothetical protein
MRKLERIEEKDKGLAKMADDLKQKRVNKLRELKEIEKQKKELEKELKQNIDSIKKEARLKEQYLLFFRQTLPLEEIKDKCEEIDKSKSRELQLREAYKQLKQSPIKF